MGKKISRRKRKNNKRTFEATKNGQIRYTKYIERIKTLRKLLDAGSIEKSLFDEKVNMLNEQFKDIFNEENKKEKDEITKLKKTEFFELLKNNLNDFISSQISNIEKYPRLCTLQEFKDILIQFDKSLKMDK